MNLSNQANLIGGIFFLIMGSTLLYFVQFSEVKIMTFLITFAGLGEILVGILLIWLYDHTRKEEKRNEIF